ncbi:MAG: putative nucleic acid-binding protein [Patescibacteria group bacterium]|jgi:predicted nucleic acid-binding protein
MIALDTTAIIDIFKQNKEIQTLLQKIEEPLASTIANYEELMFGINPENQKHKQEETICDNLFSSLYLYTTTKETDKRASKIYYTLKKSGKMIGETDCTIAAILLTNNITKIITRNTKHFQNIPNVEVITY